MQKTERQLFRTKSGAAALAIIWDALQIALKLTIGISISSIAILSEALNSSIDLLASVMAFFSIKFSSQPADEQHPFGHGKAENLSGFIEAGLMYLTSIFIIYQSIRKLLTGSQVVHVEWGLGIMLFSMTVNIFFTGYLLKVARREDSLALEAHARNLRGDILISLGVFTGLLMLKLTGLPVFDPIAAILVSIYYSITATGLTRKSVHGLLDERLPASEVGIIQASISEHSRDLAGFHDVRTRKAGGERYIDLHLVMAKHSSLEEVHKMCDHLEEDIKSKLPRSNITIHVEPCQADCETCNAVCSELGRKRG